MGRRRFLLISDVHGPGIEYQMAGSQKQRLGDGTERAILLLVYLIDRVPESLQPDAAGYTMTSIHEAVDDCESKG